MKRIFGLIMLALVIYAIFYDLNKGTLSFVRANNEESEQVIQSASKIDYFEKKVESGDTLLSIVEENLNSYIPVSIEKVIEDFKELNNGLKPQEIQYGRTYKFPDYMTLLEE